MSLSYPGQPQRRSEYDGRVSKNWANWVIYTVLRLAVFVIPLVILLALNVPQYIAVIFAAFIGVALSLLLLSKWRGAASASIYNRRVRKGKLRQDQATVLGAEEDEAVDAALEDAGFVTPERVTTQGAEAEGTTAEGAEADAVPVASENERERQSDAD